MKDFVLTENIAKNYKKTLEMYSTDDGVIVFLVDSISTPHGTDTTTTNLSLTTAQLRELRDWLNQKLD